MSGFKLDQRARQTTIISRIYKNKSSKYTCAVHIFYCPFLNIYIYPNLHNIRVYTYKSKSTGYTIAVSDDNQIAIIMEIYFWFIGNIMAIILCRLTEKCLKLTCPKWLYICLSKWEHAEHAIRKQNSISIYIRVCVY